MHPGNTLVGSLGKCRGPRGDRSHLGPFLKPALTHSGHALSGHGPRRLVGFKGAAVGLVPTSPANLSDLQLHAKVVRGLGTQGSRLSSPPIQNQVQEAALGTSLDSHGKGLGEQEVQRWAGATKLEVSHRRPKTPFVYGGELNQCPAACLGFVFP